MNTIQFTIQIDTDLEEQDIREAFTIFDNVSSLDRYFGMKVVVPLMSAGRTVTGTSPGPSCGTS